MRSRLFLTAAALSWVRAESADQSGPSRVVHSVHNPGTASNRSRSSSHFVGKARCCDGEALTNLTRSVALRACERACWMRPDCRFFSLGSDPIGGCTLCADCDGGGAPEAGYQSYELKRGQGHPRHARAARAINSWAAAFEARLLRERSSQVAQIWRREAELRGFGHAALPEAHVPRKKSPLLYFFSGMDVLTAMALFPEAPEYVMLAEWTTGELDCFEDERCAAAATESAIKAVQFIAGGKDMVNGTSNGFFYQSTRLQNEAFEAEAPRYARRGAAPGEATLASHPIGVLPTLAAMVWLLGHAVESAESLEPSGHRGVALRTVGGARFVFLSTWLSSNATRGLQQLEETRAACASPRPFVAMFKAGAHTLVRREWMARWVLQHSAGTLHDETGVPTQAYATSCALGAGSWRARLHGDLEGSRSVYLKLIQQTAAGTTRYEHYEKHHGGRFIAANASVRCKDNGMGCPHELRDDMAATLELARRQSPRPLGFRLGYSSGASMLLTGWKARAACDGADANAAGPSDDLYHLLAE